MNWQGLLLLFKMEFQQLHSILKQKNEQNIWSGGFKKLDIMQSMISILRERNPMRHALYLSSDTTLEGFQATVEDGKWSLADSLSWGDGAESPGRLCG